MHSSDFFFFSLFPVPCSSIANALAHAACERCKSGFAATEKIVNSNGELYHEQCFVCAQCFQQFPEGLFYEVLLCSLTTPHTRHTHLALRSVWSCLFLLLVMFVMFWSSRWLCLLSLQFEGRKYCEHDFQMLFAPCCHQCGEWRRESHISLSWCRLCCVVWTLKKNSCSC